MKRGFNLLILLLLIFAVGCTSYTGNATYTGKVVDTATVKVTSNIIGSLVYFDGKYSGNIGLDYIYTKSGLNPGKHVLEVKGNSEYDSVGMNINLKPSEIKEINIGLKKKAKLFVSSSVSNADVFVNNKYKGKTPITIPYLSHGTNYNVQVKKNGYVTFDTYKKVFRGETAKVHAVLQPTSSSSMSMNLKTGSLDAISNPDGATVFIDGMNIGSTGITIGGLIVGEHEVKISKSGYQDYIATVNVINNQAVPLNVDLQPLSSLVGNLFVLTNPSDVDVYVNYVLKGKTQVTSDQNYGEFTLTNLNPGTYDIKLSKSGYIDVFTTATIIAEQTTTVNKVLNLGTGNLKVTGGMGANIFKGANVYLDNLYKGKIPATVGISYLTVSNVDVGSHEVRVFKSGIDKTLSIDITGGQTTTLTCTSVECTIS